MPSTRLFVFVCVRNSHKANTCENFSSEGTQYVSSSVSLGWVAVGANVEQDETGQSSGQREGKEMQWADQRTRGMGGVASGIMILGYMTHIPPASA